MIAVHDRACITVLAGSAVRSVRISNSPPRSRASTGCVYSSYRTPQFSVRRARDLPIVLEIEAGVEVSLAGPVEQLAALGAGYESHQEIRERRARPGGIARTREDRSENQLPAAVDILEPVAGENRRLP